MYRSRVLSGVAAAGCPGPLGLQPDAAIRRQGRAVARRRGARLPRRRRGAREPVRGEPATRSAARACAGRCGPSPSPPPPAARCSCGPPRLLRCPMVPAVDHWVERVVIPAARYHLGAAVVELKVAASYSCRPMNQRRRRAACPSTATPTPSTSRRSCWPTGARCAVKTRLVGRPGRAQLPARRASRRLRRLHHRAGPGLRHQPPRPLPSRPRPPRPRRRGPHLQVVPQVATLARARHGCRAARAGALDKAATCHVAMADGC